MKNEHFYGIIMIIVSIIIITIGVPYAESYLNSIPHKEIKTITKPIYSISTSNDLSGHFIYGSGVIEAHKMFYYYEGTPKTGLVSKSINADYTVIYMDTDENPYITDTIIEYNHYYTLHIPKNSIEQKYNI